MSHAEMDSLRKVGAQAPTISVPESQNVFQQTGAYLPDHLVSREVHVNLTDVKLTESQRQALLGADSVLHAAKSEEGLDEVWAVYSHATLADLRLLKNAGISYDLVTRPSKRDADAPAPESEISFKALVDHWMRNSRNAPSGHAWIAVESISAADESVRQHLTADLQNVAVLDGHIAGKQYSFRVYGFKDAAECMQAYDAAQDSGDEPTEQWLLMDASINLTGISSPLWQAETVLLEGGH
jgi:hypothetical protein